MRILGGMRMKILGMRVLLIDGMGMRIHVLLPSGNYYLRVPNVAIFFILHILLVLNFAISMY